MTQPGQSVAASERTVVSLEQRVFWGVDVTDWLEGGETPDQLQELARNKLDYHEHQVGEQVECTGWGWA